MADGWSQLAGGIRGKRQLEQGDEIAAAALQDLAGGGQQQIPGAQSMPGQGMPPQGMPGAGSPGGGGQPPIGSPPQGGQPPPQPGQPQFGQAQPQQPGQGNIFARMFQQPAGGPPGGAPPQPSQGPPAAPPASQAIPGQRPMPGQQPMQPQGAGMPVRPQMGQGGGQQQPQGPLNLQQVIQSVVKAAGPNPNPHQVMAAISKLAPLMNLDSQMQFRQISQQLAGMRVDQGQQRIYQGEERIQQGDERLKQGETRLQQADKKLEERTREFDLRERRYGIQGEARNDQAAKRLQLQADTLRQRIIDSKDKKLLSQWRAAADAAHKQVTAKIQALAAGMPPAEIKKLHQEELDRFNEELNSVREAVGSSTPTGGTVESQKPETPFKDRFQGDEPNAKSVKTERVTRPAAGPAATGPTMAPPAGAPKPGTEEGGYRFKGGDPKDQKNWEPISQSVQ